MLATPPSTHPSRCRLIWLPTSGAEAKAPKFTGSDLFEPTCHPHFILGNDPHQSVLRSGFVSLSETPGEMLVEAGVGCLK